MSVDTTDTAAAATDGAQGDEQKQQAEQVSYTKADVERIVTDRLKRERDKIGDVKSLKAAADELAAIKESQKTEAQKSAERVAVLEREAAAARCEALKFKVAAKFQIGDEDADLFLTGTDEDTLIRQAKRLTARESERDKQGNFVAREGHRPAADINDNDALARHILLGQ